MYTALVFLPIIASAIAGLFGRFLGARMCELVTTGALFVSLALSIFVFYDVAILGHSQLVPLWTWIASGDFEADWAIRVDTLTAVMLVVVTGVSALVHLYSIGYMADDPGRPRFFSYLSLFTFAMLMLVTANNFLQVFFGWEGVGLASYLLIGFWYKKPSANAAALKAFVVNRVGDFGFMLGILAIYWTFKTLDFNTVFAAAPAMAGKTFLFGGWHVDILTTICLLLFMGAMGKSAQLGLHTWLPDAMEGPTPVSALIHAATMVTAGVFLVCRASPLYELRAGGARLRRLRRRLHGVLRRVGRPVPERHQAGDRLFDLLAARLHVRGGGRLGLWRGDVPPLHPRLLQGAAVPGRRFGHHRDASRAGHAQDGRAGQSAALHLGDDADRQSGADGLRFAVSSASARRGSIPRTPSSMRLTWRARRSAPTPSADGDRRADDVVLFLAPVPDDLPRQIPRRRGASRPWPRLEAGRRSTNPR